MKLVPTLDPVLSALLQRETERASSSISLIASENEALPAFGEILASCLSNKYAEGYPGKRYYAGCSVIDEIEQLTIDRCKTLFGAAYANVQPHAGSQANQAAYLALLKPGETLMSMKFGAGGHLTHGYTANLSGMLYRVVQYGVDPETERIDYDAVAQIAEQERPKVMVAGASSYSRLIDYERFAQIAHSVNAHLMVDMAHIAGMIAAQAIPSPVPFADVVTSTTHKTLRGPRGGFILAKPEFESLINRAVMPGIQGGPLMQQVAAKALCFELAARPEFRTYQLQILANARALSDALQRQGYKIISGGTDTHLMVVDLTNKNITGLEAEQWLEAAGITASRSTTPFGTQLPQIGNGIRLGTSVITSRGMREPECQEIAELIHEILKNRGDSAVIKKVREKVRLLATKRGL